jgi:hypothetical protein
VIKKNHAIELSIKKKRSRKLLWWKIDLYDVFSSISIISHPELGKKGL